MSLNNKYLLFAVIAVSAVSSLSFATPNHEELKTALTEKFDTLVLKGGLSNQNLNDLASKRETKVSISLDGETKEALDLSVVWEGQFRAWSATFKADKDALTSLDCENGLFSTQYVYPNWLFQNVKMTFSFKGETIKRLCQSAQHAPEAQPAISPLCSSAAAAAPAKIIRAKSPTASTIKRLCRIRTMTSGLLTAAEEYDHIWTAVFTGLEGATNLCSAVANASPFLAVLGAAQIAVACKSGGRVVERFNTQCSSDADGLLAGINESADQILIISSNMEKLLATVGDSLKGVESNLANIRVQQQAISDALSKASVEERNELLEVFEAYEQAHMRGEKAASAFAEFQMAVGEISRGWAEINSQFSALANLLKAPLEQGDSEDVVQKFKNRLLLVDERIEPLQNLLLSLQAPMNKQDLLSREVNAQRQLQDEYQSRAQMLLAQIIERNAEQRRAMAMQLAASDCQLAAACATIANNIQALEGSESKLEEIKEQARKIEIDATSARKQVASMYTTRDILIGAAVGFFVPGGAIIAVPCALGAAFVSKTTADSVVSLCLRLPGMRAAQAAAPEQKK